MKNLIFITSLTVILSSLSVQAIKTSLDESSPKITRIAPKPTIAQAKEIHENGKFVTLEGDVWELDARFRPGKIFGQRPLTDTSFVLPYNGKYGGEYTIEGPYSNIVNEVNYRAGLLIGDSVLYPAGPKHRLDNLYRISYDPRNLEVTHGKEDTIFRLVYKKTISSAEL